MSKLLQDFRAKYPAYDSISDADLAAGLHKKYYSQIPIDDFNKQLGIAPAQANIKPTAPQSQLKNETAGGIWGDDPRLESFMTKPSDLTGQLTDSNELKVNRPSLTESQRNRVNEATSKDYGQVVSPVGNFGVHIRDELAPAARQDIERRLQSEKDPAVRMVLQEELRRPSNAKTPIQLDDAEKAYAAGRSIDRTSQDQLNDPEVLSVPTGPESSLGSVASGLAQALPQGLEMTRQGIRSQFADAIGSEGMQADALRKAGAVRNEIADSTPVFESKTANAFYSGLSSFVQQVPGLAAGILSGNPVPSLIAAGLQTEAEAYTRYRDRGASPKEAITGALGEGVTEVVTERMPMGFLVDKLGKTGTKNFLIGFMAREAPGEQVATLAQDAIDTAIANPNKTWGEYWKERPSAAWDTLIATSAMAGATGALHVGARALTPQEQKKQIADAAQADISNAQSVDDALKAFNTVTETIGTVDVEPQFNADAIANTIGDANANVMPSLPATENPNVSPIAQQPVTTVATGSGITQPDNNAGGSTNINVEPIATSGNDSDLGSGQGIASDIPVGTGARQQLADLADPVLADDLVPAEVAPNKEDISAGNIDDDWVAFSPESGSLGIPRSDMPQIKAEHRGPMVNFLEARGITHDDVELPASDLKPSQLEYSNSKVENAKNFEGGNRSILISQDGHVLDGHHQWLASLDNGEKVKAIRLNAPIRQLIDTVREFPSAQTSDQSATVVQPQAQAPVVNEAAPETKQKTDRQYIDEVKQARNGAANDLANTVPLPESSVQASEDTKPIDPSDLAKRIVASKASVTHLRHKGERGFDNHFNNVSRYLNGERVKPLNFKLSALRFKPKSSLGETAEKEYQHLSSLARLSKDKKTRLEELQSRRKLIGGNQELSDLFMQLHEVAKENYQETQEEAEKREAAKQLADNRKGKYDTYVDRINAAASVQEAKAIARDVQHDALLSVNKRIELDDMAMARMDELEESDYEDDGYDNQKEVSQFSRIAATQKAQSKIEPVGGWRSMVGGNEIRSNKDGITVRKHGRAVHIRGSNSIVAAAKANDLALAEIRELHHIGVKDNPKDPFSEATIWLDGDGRMIMKKGAKKPIGAVAKILSSVKQKADEEIDSDVLFSRSENTDSPNFYSALTKSIEGIGYEKAKAMQWKMTIKNLTQKGVKQDEIEWSGINEWLDLQTGQVTKDQIVDYLNNNGVQVQDVMLSENNLPPLPDGWEVDRQPNGEYWLLDEEGEVVSEGTSEQEAIENGIDDDELSERRESAGKPKYAGYTVPGGSNYKELLLTLPVSKTPTEEFSSIEQMKKFLSEVNRPDLDGLSDLDKFKALNKERRKAGEQARPYQSSHFDQPNILAHVRFDERTDADGSRVLFIHEIQSDWGQEGKKKGFSGKPLTDEDIFRYKVLKSKNFRNELTPEEVVEFNSIGDRMGSVPDGPFVTKTDAWVSLALKRMISYAVENGFDKVAFINGQQAADLYDLSKQVNKVSAEAVEEADGVHFVDIELTGGQDINLEVENGVVREGEFSGKALADIVGKELSEKILSLDSGETKVFAGENLKVGGEGMRTFYDRIVPNVAKDVLKRLGGAVDTVAIASGEQPPKSAGFTREYPTINQVGFTITPEMREKVSQGLPLFKRGNKSTTGDIQNRLVGNVQAHVDKITTGWNNAPKINVVYDMNDSRIPEAVRRENDRQLSQGAQGQPEGFFASGQAYIVASEMQSIDDVSRVLFHEVLGHYGLRGVYGAELKKALNLVAIGYKSVVAKKAKEYGLDMNNERDRLLAAEEVLAELAQTKPELRVVKRAIAAIRTWLREHVPYFKNLELTDDELIRNFILPARQFVENGGAIKSPAGVVAAFNRTSDFGRQVDDAISGNSKGALTLGMTPRALVSAGVPDLPLMLTQQVVDKVFYDHGIPARVIKSLPDLLSKPLMIFKSDTRPDSFVVVTDAEKNGNQVIVSIKSNGEVEHIGPVNVLTSAYDKADGVITSWIEKGLLLGADKKKALAWTSTKGIKGVKFPSRNGNPAVSPSPENGQGSSVLEKLKSAIRKSVDVNLSEKVGDVNDGDGKPSFSREKNNLGLEPESDLDALIRKQQNDQVRWLRQIDAIKERGGKVTDQNDVYQAMERMSARAMTRTEDFYDKNVTPLLDDMQKVGITLNELGEYLYALHAKERNAYIKQINPAFADTGYDDVGGSGMSDAEADEIVNRINNDERAADYNRFAQTFRDWAEQNLNNLVEGGLLDAGQAAAMRQRFPNYVPLKGFESKDEVGGMLFQGAGFSNGKKLFQSALGRRSKADNPASYIIHSVAEGMLAKEKAHVGGYLERLIKDNPDDSLWTIDKPEKTPTLGKDSAGNPTVIELDRGYDADKEVRFIRDGKQVRIQLKDPLLARAYNNRGQSEIGAVSRMAASINSFLREMWTQKNPVFPVVNMVRDVPSGMLYATGEGGFGLAGKLFGNLPGAWLTMWKQSTGRPVKNNEWAKWLTEYRAAGGGIGYRMVSDIESTMNKINNIQKQFGGHSVIESIATGQYKQAVNRALWKTYNNAVTEFIEHINMAFENMTRLAIYRAARESGMSASEASRLSKNATVNFNRKGEETEHVRSWYLFANAAIQDVAKNKRSVMDATHKNKVRAVLAGVAALGFAMGLLSGDDDDLEEENRNVNAIRFKMGSTTINIPLSYGLIGFMHYFGRSAAKVLKGEDVSLQSLRLAGALFTNLIPVNPIPNPDRPDVQNLIVGTTPTPFQFPIQVALNRNSFGSDMRPDYNDNPDAYKSFRGTRGSIYSDITEWLNETTGGDKRKPGVIDVSPETLKAFIHFSLGGTGKFVADTTSTATDIADGGSFNANKVPVLNRFVSEDDVTTYRARFYRQAGEARAKLSLANKYRKDGNKERFKENRTWIVTGRTGNRLWKQMNELRDQELMAKDNLSGNELDTKLKSIEDRQIAISNRFNEMYQKTSRN